MDKFWNGKLLGLFGALFLIVGRIINMLLDKVTTETVSWNIKECGTNTVIRRGFQYRNPKKITIGKNVELGKNVIFSSELNSGEIIIEDEVTIGRNCRIDFSGKLIIKKGSLLSEGVNIQTHDHGLDPKSIPNGKELIIDEKCWIGMNVTILSNVKYIAKNTVIGANSLVTKEIRDSGIYVGSPLKKLVK